MTIPLFTECLICGQRWNSGQPECPYWDELHDSAVKGRKQVTQSVIADGAVANKDGTR